MHHRIREDMNVVASDGVQIGFVDRMEGDRIKLGRHGDRGGGAGTPHRYLPISCVAKVRGDEVVLDVTARYVRRTAEAIGHPV